MTRKQIVNLTPEQYDALSSSDPIMFKVDELSHNEKTEVQFVCLERGVYRTMRIPGEL